MTRILVTGAGGFIGRHSLEPLMERGFEVHAVTRAESLPGAAECHAVNLMDSGDTFSLLARVRPTHLIHFAWSVKPGQFFSTRENLDWVAATLKLYRGFVAQGGQRFIGAGTCAEYSWLPPQIAQPLDEHTSICEPATLYGSTKYGLFRMLSQAAELDGISFAWGRVFFLYGSGEKQGRLISDVIDKLLRGKAVKTTAGTQLRDFMYVADVACAFAALAASKISGPINIASGKVIPLKLILGEIAHQTGAGHLLRIGALPMPIGEPPQLVANTGRLCDELGFKPRHDIVSGISETIQAWNHLQA